MRVKTSENNGEEKWRDVAHLDRQRKKKKVEALAFPKVYNHHESGRGRAYETKLGLYNSVSNQALLGDVARRLTPTPSASVCSFPDPDTLSSDSIDSLRVQLRLVNQRINNVHKTIRTKDERGESPLCGSLFVQKIKDTPIPQHFHLTMLEVYDDGSDPIEHVAAFQMQMALYRTSDTIMCRAFSTTLRGITRGWYGRLPPSSINSFDQLAREFEANFRTSARPKPIAASLLGMRANQYVAAETLVAEKRKDQKRPRAEPSRGPPPGLPRKRTERAEHIVPRPPNILLNSTRTEIILQIREKGLIKTPNPMKSRVEDRDHRHYCRFHCDYGHDTEECSDLKNQIEDLIRRGHLDRYIRKPRESSLHSKGPMERQVDVIIGDPATGGDSSSARKSYTCRSLEEAPSPGRSWDHLRIRE
ncbi:hypothetical protein B296_00008639 [Ensete ventricosum]|uniref:Retrotransposon gag domain-containing protein n=1 Tax=Ensete ventricosum TaxID=4639 RepID=A0A427A8C0_ENSVE|nr:hypothetical protein B296_00008639 [Ensete ventricosum]